MKKHSSLFAVLTVFAICSKADEPPAPGKFYHLHFVVQEVNGTKIVNSREYDTAASTEAGGDCSIRTESRVNRIVGAGSTSYQTYSLGVKIDGSGLRELGNGLALQVRASLDTLAQEEESNNVANHGPVVRTDNWYARLLIPLKKPTVLFSSDDLTSKHRMQMLLTATPIN